MEATARGLSPGWLRASSLSRVASDACAPQCCWAGRCWGGRRLVRLDSHLCGCTDRMPGAGVGWLYETPVEQGTLLMSGQACCRAVCGCADRNARGRAATAAATALKVAALTADAFIPPSQPCQQSNSAGSNVHSQPLNVTPATAYGACYSSAIISLHQCASLPLAHATLCLWVRPQPPAAPQRSVCSPLSSQLFHRRIRFGPSSCGPPLCSGARLLELLRAAGGVTCKLTDTCIAGPGCGALRWPQMAELHAQARLPARQAADRRRASPHSRLLMRRCAPPPAARAERR